MSFLQIREQHSKMPRHCNVFYGRSRLTLHFNMISIHTLSLLLSSKPLHTTATDVCQAAHVGDRYTLRRASDITCSHTTPVITLYVTTHILPNAYHSITNKQHVSQNRLFQKLFSPMTACIHAVDNIAGSAVTCPCDKSMTQCLLWNA